MPISRGFLRDCRRTPGVLPLRAKRNDPEEMHTYAGHPEEEIELARYSQQQNQQREIAVGRGINQFFEARRFATTLALHEAHDHGEADDRSEHGADSERKRRRCRIVPTQAAAAPAEKT